MGMEQGGKESIISDFSITNCNWSPVPYPLSPRTISHHNTTFQKTVLSPVNTKIYTFLNLSFILCQELNYLNSLRNLKLFKKVWGICYALGMLKGQYKLSSASLGLDVEEKREVVKNKKVHFSERFQMVLRSQKMTPVVKNGLKIWMRRYPDYARMKIFSDLVIPPSKRWFPSKRAVFNIGSNDDPEYIFNQVNPKFNPAVWYNKKRKTFAIIVPKFFSREVREELEKTFRYEPNKDVWIRRTYAR